jgi:hypothetical protein
MMTGSNQDRPCFLKFIFRREAMLDSSAFRLAALLALAAGQAIYAVDGVILIDQTKALAGNVTPGDAPGFPVTISQPGSYRLDSNLAVPDMTSGILIESDNVTIDLNGFSILGPVTCQKTSGAFTCSELSFGGAGIYAALQPAHSNLTIRNGFIQGLDGAIYLFSDSNVLIDHMQISNCPFGVYAGSGVIRDSLITSAGASQLYGGVMENVVLAYGDVAMDGAVLTIMDSVFLDHDRASFVVGENLGFSGVAFILEPAPASGYSLGQNTVGGSVW